MPPRRSVRVAAVAERQSSALAPLPHALALYIFSLLPVDQRMRCAEVCRGWRAALSDASLWLRLDLSLASGVARATNALMLAAAARTAGRLQALDVSGCARITDQAVRAVAAENAGALVELRMASPMADLAALCVNVRQLEALLQAAPLLRALEADVNCRGVEEARRLLRNEAPFGPLRMRILRASGLADAAAVRNFAQYAVEHAWVTGVHVIGAPLNEPAALDAVVDLTLQCRLTYLELYDCELSPHSAPALARLFGGSALRTLLIDGEGMRLLDEPAAVLLGNALRANTTLTSVTFWQVGLFNNVAAAAALLGALTAHRTLQKLDLSLNHAGELAPAALAATGAALGTLVAANAPALRELRLGGCSLTDDGLGPLVDALPANAHLRVLHCRFNGLSEAFKRERLLPAVRANAWLEALVE
jgi:bacterioferritin-associated ferredoxin